MRSEIWKWFKLIGEILIIAGVIWLVVSLVQDIGLAEDATEVKYVICAPGDYVNIREKASSRSESIGRFEPGYEVYTDGIRKNGYLHCVHLGLELDEGWICEGYTVDEHPEYLNCTATIVSKGRLAARKNVGGKRTRWLKPMATVKVWYWTSEWSLTNCGYVQSEFLDLDGE